MADKRSALTPTQKARLDELRRERRPAPSARPGTPPLTPAPRSGALPLSYEQEALWLFDQRARGFAGYRFTTPFRLSGALDVEALRRAFDALGQRHETLRTTFAAPTGDPEQPIPPRPPWSLEVVDLRGLPADESERRERRHL